VSRAAKQSRSQADRVKDLPWALLLQAGVIVGRRWRGLSAEDRERLATLLRRSGGRPSSLSGKERKELRKLSRKLDLKGLGGELAALRGGRGRRRAR
jgi:hypothetical protein